MDRWYTKNARRKTIRTIRLSRWLSKCGVASRSVSAEWIEHGRVSVNGREVRNPELGIAPGQDRVAIDGRTVTPTGHLALLLNKPVDVVTTALDPEGRKTVYDFIPKEMGWIFPVGRLDRMSSGLLLMTNDTRLGERLTHHAYGVPKTYLVKVRGTVGEEIVERLRRGVRLDDGYVTRPAHIRRLTPPEPPGGAPATWLEFTLDEGKNRQIRRMCEGVGHPVERLKRVRIGPLTIRGLEPGAWRMLSDEERRSLRESVGLTPVDAEHG